MAVLMTWDTATRHWPVRRAVLRAVRRVLPGLHHCPRTGWHVRSIFPMRVGPHIFYVDSRERFGVSRWLLQAGDYGADERALLTSVLRAGDVFVEFGANIGVFVPHASACVGPTGQVIAIEPSPEHVNLLRRTVRANRLTNVTVHAAAVGDHEGSITLYRSAENTADHHTYARAGDRQPVSVPLLTIDSLNLRRVDVILMDIQGAEGAALHGMRATLKRNPNCTLLMEFWPRAQRLAGGDPLAVLTDLVRDGWQIYADTTRQPNTTAQAVEYVAPVAISASALTAALEAKDQFVNLIVARSPRCDVHEYQPLRM